jgi:hypothetical protein
VGADLLADLLLGRLAFDDDTDDATGDDGDDDGDDDTVDDDDHHDDECDGDCGDDTTAASEDPDREAAPAEAGVSEWVEVEEIDPDTGELLGTHLQRVDSDGQPVGDPVDPCTRRAFGLLPKPATAPQGPHRSGGAALKPVGRQRHAGRAGWPVRIHPRGDAPATNRRGDPGRWS